jgi:hypothetical protein
MPSNNRQSSLSVDSHLKLKDEISTLHPQPKPASPTMSNILKEMGPLPREVLFLGVASDGLPVLLNLHDPLPGPLLVVGDPGAGKTLFLQSVVRTLTQTHRPGDLQYGIVTCRPDQWDEVVNTPHRVGVFDTNETLVMELIKSMTKWAHENKKTRQSVLLMVDDLEAFAKLDFAALQNFRWLLARGPSRQVWPIITMDAERYGQVISWIPNFRTRIFGRIKDEGAATVLGGDKKSDLDQLEAPNQFSLRENDSWIRFRLPD